MNSMEDRDLLLIIAYFDLQLSEDELIDFEKRLSEDSDFANKVMSYQKSIEIVESVDPNSEENVRKNTWKVLLREQKSGRKRKMLWMTRIAAALVIILVTALYFNSQQSNLDKQLQDAWDREVGLDFILRNNSVDSSRVTLSKALTSYRNGEYLNTLHLVEKYDASSTGSYDEILMLRALANYQLDRSEIALQILDTLETNEVQVARWYKGLIYLEQGNTTKAKEYLEIPKNSEGKIKLKKE